MRPELNEIQYIEQYLRGKLDTSQRLEFEKQLISDPAFKEKVELQEQLMQGIKNRALRNSIIKAHQKVHFKKKLKWGLGSAGVIILITAAVLLASSISSINEEGEKENSTGLISNLDTKGLAGRSLPDQLFNIQGDRDTVVETKDGIVFAIEAGTFVDNSNHPINGPITISVKEALEVGDIISSGLSTVTTSGEELETGGMFSIKASAKGEALNINPEKGIYSQIPTEEKKPGMKLWNGVYQKDGQVLWNSSKELEKYLLPVDMSLLNFYPKDFESNLHRLGFPNATKRQKDSVYYSFASHFSKKGRSQFLVSSTIIQEQLVVDSIVGGSSMEVKNKPIALKLEDPNRSSIVDGATTPTISVSASNVVPDEQIVVLDTSYTKDVTKETYYRYPIKTGLNPIKIKAFWNSKFNGSLLATQEFEKRMHLIHQTGSSDVLDLYLKNAGKRLWEIDLMAAEITQGKIQNAFKAFSVLKEGRVKTNPRLVKMLNGFYRQKELNFRISLNKASAFWKEQQKKDRMAEKMGSKYDEKEEKRKAANLKKEISDNIDHVYKQLGVKRPFYRAIVRRTGWSNIDKRVDSTRVMFDDINAKSATATSTRTSTSFKYKGKVAKIKYTQFILHSPGDYERVYAYLLSPKLPSFQRMNFAVVDTEFIENELGELRPLPIKAHQFKINDNYQYGLAVIGYRGDSTFTYFQSELVPDKIENDSLKVKYVNLKFQDDKSFYKQIKKYSSRKSFKTDIKKDLLFENYFKAEEKRKETVKGMVSFRREMQEYVFPLYYVNKGFYLVDKFDHELDRLAINVKGSNEDKTSLVLLDLKFTAIGEYSQDMIKSYETKTIYFFGKNNRMFFQLNKDVRDEIISQEDYGFQKEGGYFVADDPNYHYKMINVDFEYVDANLE